MAINSTDYTKSSVNSTNFTKISVNATNFGPVNVAIGVLLLETGDKLLLENGIDSILLEAIPSSAVNYSKT